ncbi:unnamed protein product [Dicrocoelium dendriticum]|nr:unnamed protein product [Dicrocoelium dendriticum]
MLYGGPLGTYLSGISSASTVTQGPSSSTGYLSNPYTPPNYLGTSLRRNTSRYRSNTSIGSGLPTTSQAVTSNGTSSTSPSLSSYYTPQVRRKYATSESEPAKATGRYLSRTPTRGSNFANTTVSSTNPIQTSTSSSLPDNSATGPCHYPRRSPCKNIPAATGYSGSTSGNSSSWNLDFSTAAAGSVDYKRLYEAEKLATDALRAEIALAQKETRDLQGQIESAMKTRRSNNVEQRKLERRISECEEELKVNIFSFN